MNKISKNNNSTYKQMEKEYSKLFTPEIENCLVGLDNVIASLEINGFGMPLIIQNQIYSTLLEAKQVLCTLSINKQTSTYKHPPTNNPLSLLLSLNTLSQQLNQHSLKSPFYLLLNKANNLILICINKILKYFLKSKIN